VAVGLAAERGALGLAIDGLAQPDLDPADLGDIDLLILDGDAWTSASPYQLMVSMSPAVAS